MAEKFSVSFLWFSKGAIAHHLSLSPCSKGEQTVEGLHYVMALLQCLHPLCKLWCFILVPHMVSSLFQKQSIPLLAMLSALLLP